MPHPGRRRILTGDRRTATALTLPAMGGKETLAHRPPMARVHQKRSPSNRACFESASHPNSSDPQRGA
jgi:hypothetical protein